MQLSNWSLFLFLKLRMRRRLCELASRIVGGLYNTHVWGVTEVRNPEVAVSNPSIGQTFQMFPDTP